VGVGFSVVAGVSRWWQEFLLSPDTVAVRRELLTAQEKVF